MVLIVCCIFVFSFLNIFNDIVIFFLNCKALMDKNFRFDYRWRFNKYERILVSFDCMKSRYRCLAVRFVDYGLLYFLFFFWWYNLY